MEFVSWDDYYIIPNIWKVIKFMFQTTNQIGYYCCEHIIIYNHYNEDIIVKINIII